MKNKFKIILIISILTSTSSFGQFEYSYKQISQNAIEMALDIEPMDFENDGDIDFVVSSRDFYYNNSLLNLLINEGDGNYTKLTVVDPLPEEASHTSYFRFIKVFDINQDGLSDLFVYKYDYYFIPPFEAFFSNQYILRFLNNGENLEILDTLFLPNLETNSIADFGLIDINKDGHNDLIIGNTNLCIISNEQGQLLGSITQLPSTMILNKSAVLLNSSNNQINKILTSGKTGSSLNDNIFYTYHIELPSLNLIQIDSLYCEYIEWYGVLHQDNAPNEDLIYRRNDSLFIKRGSSEGFLDGEDFQFYSFGSNNKGVHFINYNNDEYLDIVFENNLDAVILQNQNGMSFVPVSSVLNNQTLKINFVADVNNDGLHEIFMSYIKQDIPPYSLSNLESYSLDFQLNKYRYHETVYTDNSPANFLVDLNSDGRIDIISDYSWWKNDTDNENVSYNNLEYLFNGRPLGQIIAAIDVDGDSFKDLITNRITNDDSLIILLNNGNQLFNDTFLFDLDYDFQVDIQNTGIYDLNNDGKDDLILFHKPVQNGVQTNSFFTVLSVNEQTNNLNVAAKVDISDGNWYTLSFSNSITNGKGISFADLDNNGFEDIIVFALNAGTPCIVYYLNFGDFSFSEPYILPVDNEITAILKLQVVDINNDGYKDLVYNYSTLYEVKDEIIVHYGISSTAFMEPQTWGLKFADFIFYDINNDGDSDLIGCNYSSNADPDSNWIKIFVNDGFSFNEIYSINNVYVKEFLLDTSQVESFLFKIIATNVTYGPIPYLRKETNSTGVYTIKIDQSLGFYNRGHPSNKSYFTAHPNPTNSELTIRMHNGLEFLPIVNTEYKLFDLLGNLHMHGFTSDIGLIVINQCSGVYILNLNNLQFLRIIKN